MPYATAHNGGTLQVNVGDPQGGGEYPFINQLKTCQQWEKNVDGGPPDPHTLDANGFPTAFGAEEGVSTVFFTPAPSTRPGNYVIKWTGEGTINLVMAATLVSGSFSNIGAGPNGRAVVSISQSNVGTDQNIPSAARWALLITARGAGSYINKLAVVHEDDEAAYDAGEIFSPLFKQRLLEGGFGVIRDLSYCMSNETNVCLWSDRKTFDYYTWGEDEYRAAFWDASAGQATNGGSGNAYTLTRAGVTLTHNTRLHLSFNAKPTDENAFTLNVNGLGARPVYSSRGVPIDPSVLPGGGRIVTIVFDADLNAWLVGGDGKRFGLGIRSHAPPEVTLRLCAEIGAHPWFVIPGQTLARMTQTTYDPATDYAHNLAAYVKSFCEANGITWMVPRFEGPNECWNNFAGFFVTDYAREKAQAQWGEGSNFDQWYGRSISLIGQAVASVYGAGNKGTKYHVIAGFQSANPLGSTFGNTPRLEAQHFVAQGGSAAKNWATHITVTNYFNTDYSPELEQTTAEAWAAATGAAKDAIMADFAESTMQNIDAGFKAVTQIWASLAAQYGLGLTYYEGGYSPDFLYTPERNALRKASKNHEAITRAVLRCYDAATSVGGTFPSVLNFSGEGAFSHMVPDIYATNSPAWQGVRLYAQGRRKIKLK